MRQYLLFLLIVTTFNQLFCQQYLLPRPSQYKKVKEIVIQRQLYQTNEISISYDSVSFFFEGERQSHPLRNVNYIALNQKNYWESFGACAILYTRFENYIYKNEYRLSSQDQLTIRVTGIATSIILALILGKEPKTTVFHVNKRKKEVHYYTKNRDYELKYYKAN